MFKQRNVRKHHEQYEMFTINRGTCAKSITVHISIGV